MRDFKSEIKYVNDKVLNLEKELDIKNLIIE